MATDGDLWADDIGNEGKSLQRIRSMIRTRRGKNGTMQRKNAKDKSLFTDKVELPRSWKETVPDYHLSEGLWLTIADLHIPMHLSLIHISEPTRPY